MNASEIMLEVPATLHPHMDLAHAVRQVADTHLDVVPVVDVSGNYCGVVAKSALLTHVYETGRTVLDVSSRDALTCAPDEPLEALAHDAAAAVPHQTIVVVAGDGRFCGVIPHVHWAVDEAKTQGGHPRNRLEARTVAMHLTWRCTECGELVRRNDGLPNQCPVCGADSGMFALYTED